MNCLNIVNQIKFIQNNDDDLCEHIKKKYIIVKNNEELKKKLNKYNYDYNKNENLLNAKTQNQDIEEEVFVSDIELYCTSDNTKLKWSEVQFSFIEYCNELSVINIKDEGNYCEKCYTKLFPNYPKFDTLKKAIGDKTQCLPVSKKIQYILEKNHGIRMSSTEIYKKGYPWHISGNTPKNTIAARCSTLCRNGVIKKENRKYYTI